MIDFPNSPIVGQQFSVAGATWTWDGTKWEAAGGSQVLVPAMNDNRIINGDMRIDQRNNGASGTAINTYTIDRWKFVSNQTEKATWGQNLAGTAGPIGFPYYLGFTSSSAYTVAAGDYFAFQQYLEADAISDFAFGTANAQPVTLSFWARSSLTGSFGGAILNYAATRSYPFSFSLPTANTWTKIVISIPADTAGTWVMSGNGGSLYVSFDLGTGATYRGPANVWASTAYFGVTGAVSLIATNGATFYVTGVKLEIGTVATPFNRYSLAKSMADCQRYYSQSYGDGNSPGTAGVGGDVQIQIPQPVSGSLYCNAFFPVKMRAIPTVTPYSTTVANNPNAVDTNNGNTVSATQNIGQLGFTAGNSTSASVFYMKFQWTASAEL